MDLCRTAIREHQARATVFPDRALLNVGAAAIEQHKSVGSMPKYPALINRKVRIGYDNSLVFIVADAGMLDFSPAVSVTVTVAEYVPPAWNV